MQTKFEIENGNMEIKNKKTFKEFKTYIQIILKKNLYYISQRLIISYIIENIYSAFFEVANQLLNIRINNIINIDTNKDIKLLLENLFLIKFKDFGDKWGIDLQIKKTENDELYFSDMNEIENDEFKQNNNTLNINSYDYFNNDNEYSENKKLDTIPLEINNWFPFNKNNKLKFIRDEILI